MQQRRDIAVKTMAILLLFTIVLHAQDKRGGGMEGIVSDYLTSSRDIGDLKTLIGLLDGDVGTYSPQFERVPSINPLNPKNQKRVSSTFGNRFHPIEGKVKPHYGIDISAPAGTPIHAAASGVVQSVVDSDTGYGNQVIMDHGFGFRTRYAHMYLSIVEKGSRLQKGDIIGFVGSTGKSTGNHIHYEIWKNGRRIDPFPFLDLDIDP